MRCSLAVMLVMALTLAGRASAGQGTKTYYVQLVRGTEANQPPAPGCKEVGPRLIGTFCPVLKWKNFWEMSRRQVAVPPGGAKRVKLGHGREVEIDLSDPKQRLVSAFQAGQLVDKTIIPAGQAMTIIGGNRDGKSLWFIVVRRDKPSD
jgi:hypothetical protein